MNKEDIYKECERLKRMDLHIMRYDFGGLTFIYEESYGVGKVFVRTRENIITRDSPIWAAEVMTRETFIEFCKDYVSGTVKYCGACAVLSGGEKTIACKECRHNACSRYATVKQDVDGGM